MQGVIKGILLFDIVGSTKFAHHDIERIIGAIRESIRMVITDDTHVQAQVAGDGGVLVFPTPQQSYEGLRKLIRGWTNSRKGITSPFVPGIRLSLHAGMLTTLKDHNDALFGLPVMEGSRLMAVAPHDTVAISQEAFQFLRERIESEGVSVSHQSLSLKHGQLMEAYVIGINDLLKPDQYLIRIEPPTDLLLYLASHPEELYNVSPRKFEEVMAQLFADFGYDVELTKQTRDRGIDIVAITRDSGIGMLEKYLVQCKRNAPKNKVGIQIVHEILGLGTEEPNTGLVIVTTSTFTKPAVDLAQKESVRWRLHLKDYHDIHNWLHKYASKKIGT